MKRWCSVLLCTNLVVGATRISFFSFIMGIRLPIKNFHRRNFTLLEKNPSKLFAKIIIEGLRDRSDIFQQGLATEGTHGITHPKQFILKGGKK